MDELPFGDLARFGSRTFGLLLRLMIRLLLFVSKIATKSISTHIVRRVL